MDNPFLQSIKNSWNTTHSNVESEINNSITEITRRNFARVYENILVVEHRATAKNDKRAFNLRNAHNNNNEAIKHIATLKNRRGKYLEDRDRQQEVLDIKQQIRNIEKNVLVARVQDNTENENPPKEFIVYTRNILTSYLDLEGVRQDIDMGRYKMVFKRDRQTPEVYNLTMDYLNNPHPCVDGRSICLGEYQEILRNYILGSRFDLFVDTLIMFLVNVESNNPHKSIVDIVKEIDEAQDDEGGDDGDDEYQDL